MELPHDQKAYWDGVAESKRFTHPWREEFLGDCLPERAKVLDLGCGQGRLLSTLQQRGHRIRIGLDSSHAMLKEARAHSRESCLVQGRATVLPFASQSFGGVVLFSVLTCVPRTQDQDELFGEIQRVLSIRGVLVISDLLQQVDERNQKRYRQGRESFGQPDVFQLPEGVVLTHPSRERLDTLLSPFRVERFESFSVQTMNGNAAGAFQVVARRI